MKKHIFSLLSVFKKASLSWWDKDPFKESAVIAYYSIFSLPGLLVVIVTVAGYFFGKEAVHGQIASQITSTLGPETATQIQDIIINATESKNTMLASIIGIIVILLGATGVFVQFQKSLNNIWKVQADAEKSGIISFLKARLFSFGLIVSIAFMLMVSLVVSALLAALGNWVSTHFSPSFLLVLQIFNTLISLGVFIVLFALMFKFFPDARIKWKHVWIGSFVTSLLFELGKTSLGLYFGKANPGSGYGAAGSIVLILLWVSYSSMIVFFGAEFTHAYAEAIDDNVLPDENAVKIPKK